MPCEYIHDINNCLMILSFVEIRTIIFLIILTCILAGGLLLIYSKYQAKREGIKMIGYAFLASALGFLFLLNHNEHIHLILPGNTLIVTSFLLLYHGFAAMISSEKRKVYMDLLFLLLFITGFIYLLYAHNSMRNRVIYTSIIELFYFLRIARISFKNRKMNIAVTILSYFFFFLSIALFLRVFFTTFQDLSKTLHLNKPGFIQTITITVYQLLLITISMWTLWYSSIKNESTLQNLASTDPLTGLFNRRAFIKYLNDEVNRSIKFGSKFTLFMIDIDHFKAINDKYGHDVGDKVLIEVKERLIKSVRNSDIVFRIGGEEFTVILPNTTSDLSLNTAKRIKENVSNEPIIINDINITVTVCIGISEYMNNKDSLIKNSDVALYKAKVSGRNAISLNGLCY